MNERIPRKLVLETGEEYYGTGFGSTSDKVSELVFNTSMVGYQELLSDPSYTDQAVVMTYPLIGNYGMNDSDYESERFGIDALIVRNINDEPSHFESSSTLSDIMKRHDIAGISGVDTREITRILRDHGTMKSMIADAVRPKEECLKILSEYNYKHDSVSRATSPEIKTYPADKERFRVVLIDCGAKLNIVRSLNERGIGVIVVPFDTKTDTILSYKPDGVFISNGPGDPEDVVPVINTVKEIKGSLPLCGICLGHQIISIAYGAHTYKLKFGHRGANHPVKNLLTGKIEITSQNHSYAVNPESLKKTRLKATHINLLDNTIEGAECIEDRVFSVQFHPESAPGPNDSHYLFDKFVNLLEVYHAETH